MLDIIIRGGDVVTPQGVAQGRRRHQGRDDRGRRGARRAARRCRRRRVIDATGKIVMPGGIDPHVHCSTRSSLPTATRSTRAGPITSAWPRSSAAPRR